MNYYDTLFLSKKNMIVVRTELACLIGLNEAIVLNQIDYWLGLYREDPDRFKRKHFRDGKWWVFNSFKRWKEQFPFWSICTLKRTFKKLKDDNLISCSNEYNERNYDKTMWYTINYDEVYKLYYSENKIPCDPSIKMIPTLVSDCYQPQYQNDTTNTIDYHTIDYLPKNNPIKYIVSVSPGGANSEPLSESENGHRISSWKGWESPKDYYNYLEKVLPNKLSEFHYWCVKLYYDKYLEQMGEPHPPYSSDNLEKVSNLIDMYNYDLDSFEKAADLFFSKDIKGGYHLLLFLSERFQENLNYELERLEV